MVGATSQELQAWTTGTVGDTHSSSKLDAIGGKHKYREKSGKMWTYKSPKDTLCANANGRWASTISSTPLLASAMIGNQNPGGVKSQ